MKKLLLLFAVMLTTVGVFAETLKELSAIEELSNNKAYYLSTSRGALVYNPENADQLSSTAAYKGIADNSENAEWAIYKALDGNFYFYSLNGKKYVGQNTVEGGRFPLTETPTSNVQIVASTKDGYPFVFSTDNYGAINHFNHETAPGVANWKGNDGSGGLRALNDDGSAHKIYEVRDLTSEEMSAIEEAFAYVSFTYSYKFNGIEKATETFNKVVVGGSYPNPSVDLPYGIVATKPQGSVTESDEKSTIEISLTQNLPFVAYNNTDDITCWYYLKMHTNATYTKYIQYLEGENYIEWADQSMDFEELDSYSWAFVGNVYDGFVVVNKAAGLNKAICSTGSGKATISDYSSATKFEYSRSKSNTDKFCLRYPNGGDYLNAQGNAVNHWGDNDNGSTFIIDEALPIKLTTDDSNPYCYALKSGRPGEFWYTYDSSDGKISLGDNTGADTQLWFFKGLYQDGKLCVQLYPKADPDKAMSYQNTNSEAAKIVAQVPETEGWKNTWKFVNTNGDAPYGLRTPGDENYLSNNGGTGNKMGMWNASPVADDGTAIYIYQTIDNIITDMAGNTYESTSFAQIGEQPEPIYTGVVGYTLSNKCWIDNKFTADIDFGFPVSKDGGVTNATMIRQGSWEKATAPKKWHAVLEDEEYYVKVKTQTKTTEYVPSVSEVASWLWAIYPKYDNDNGAFSFSVKNINTGTYVAANTSVIGDFQGNNKPISLETTPTYFTIESRNAGKMFSYMAGENLNNKHYLTINSENDTDVYLGSYTGTHSGNDINFPIISYTASITDAKAATLYTPVAVTIPKGVTAKYVKAEENEGSEGVLRYTKLEETIPANTAVVLTGEAADYTFTVANDAAAVTDNVLFGYAVETAADDNTGIYALANKTTGVAFYPFAGTTYKAGKAYLNVSALNAAGIRLFNIFDEGTETAIESVEGENGKAEIYDLAGRRVQNAQKGVFIVDGKVVIK